MMMLTGGITIVESDVNMVVFVDDDGGGEDGYR